LGILLLGPISFIAKTISGREKIREMLRRELIKKPNEKNLSQKLCIHYIKTIDFCFMVFSKLPLEREILR